MESPQQAGRVLSPMHTHRGPNKKHLHIYVSVCRSIFYLAPGGERGDVVEHGAGLGEGHAVLQLLDEAHLMDRWSIGE